MTAAALTLGVVLLASVGAGIIYVLRHLAEALLDVRSAAQSAAEPSLGARVAELERRETQSDLSLIHI